MGITFRHLLLWPLCLGCVVAVPIHAFGGEALDPVVLQLSGGPVAPGGMIALALESTGAAPDTLVLQLAFDTAMLQVCDVVPGGDSQDKAFAFRSTPFGFVLVIYGGAGALSSGLIATMFVEAAPGVSPGEVSLGDNGSSAADEDANARAVFLTAAPVTVMPLAHPHSADTDQNGRIAFSELLRLIQLHNAEGFHCDGTSEDGFAPGNGDRDCAPHDSDYATQDWRIELSELLRGIQFYNAFKGAYHEDGMGEDGFAPGL